MVRKRIWIFAGIVVFVLSFVMMYWFYFSKPASFPADKQLVKEINRVFPQATASVIQDTIFIDEYHVLVPFISNKNDYSLSYWIWQKHKWKVTSINVKGHPMIWKINKEDPSTFHFVWNLDPDDQVSAMKFYVMRNRGYEITEGIDNYTPAVQMEQEVPLREKSYGALQLSDEWVLVMNSFIDVEVAKQSKLFFNDFFPEHTLSFGWLPYDQSGKAVFPENSVNGSGYSNGNERIERVFLLGEEDIEFPAL